MNNQASAEMIETIKKKKQKKVAGTPVVALQEKKHKVAQTSVDAYNETAGARVTEKERIITFIEHHPGSSRDEISEGTQLKLQSVTGNVTPLVRNGSIDERETKRNKAGRKVKQLWPVSPCSKLSDDKKLTGLLDGTG